MNKKEQLLRVLQYSLFTQNLHKIRYKTNKSLFLQDKKNIKLNLAKVEVVGSSPITRSSVSLVFSVFSHYFNQIKNCQIVLSFIYN